MRPVSLRAARRHVHRSAPPRWGRWRLRSGWSAVLLLGAIAAAGTPWWPSLVQTVRVALQEEAGLVLVELELHGAAQLAVADVQDALDLEPGMPLLELDVHAARDRLQALGWVERATVRRRLPDRLVVEVREHRPLAVWLGPDGPALVAASGVAVPTERLVDHVHLPRLVGAAAPAAAPRLMQALAASPDLVARLERMERLPSERWRLRFRPGVRIELPPGPVEPAVARLIALQDEADILGRAVGVVDLRVADRVVVTPWPLVQRPRSAAGGAT